MFSKKLYKWILTSFVLSVLLVVAACGEGKEETTTSDNQNGENEERNENESSDSKTTWKMTTYLPSEQLSWKNVVVPMAEEIEEVTEGRITAELYPGSALGEPDQLYDMAATGTADVSVGNYGYTPGQFPLMGVNDLPFIADSAAEGSYIAWNLWEEYEEEFKQNHKGVKAAWLYKIDPYDIFTVDKKVTKPEDMKGLKIRTPSPGGSRLLELVGATPVEMPMGDVYQSMQRGVIDGALVPASVLAEFSLSEVTDYIYKGDFFTQSFFSFINRDTWESVSTEDQNAIDELMGEKASLEAGEAFDEAEQLGWEAAEEEGVEIYEPSEEELAEWKDILEPMNEEWISEMEEEGYPAEEIFNTAQELSDQYEEQE